MFFVDQIELPQLGFRGHEADMSEEERAIEASAHRFAEVVTRPQAWHRLRRTSTYRVVQGETGWRQDAQEL